MRTASALTACLLGCVLSLVALVAPSVAAHASGTLFPASALQRLDGQTMGTTWSVTLQADPASLPNLQHNVQARLEKVVAQMSTWESTSDLSRFNRAPRATRQPIPPELRQVMQAALALAESSGGAFDPTVGPLVNLWGFGPDGVRRTPDAGQLAKARARVGWQRLQLDASGVMTQPGDAYVDLSAIAKGYAVDQVARLLLQHGVPAFLVEVGGELRSHGRKPDGSGWRIAVEQPSTADFAFDADTYLGEVVVLEDMAMATSGDYRHFFDQDGQRYSHTIDPRSGRPVSHAMASVTVLHPECMEADALATALTVLGPEQGWEYASRHKLAALLIWHDGDGYQRRMTPRFRAALAPS